MRLFLPIYCVLYRDRNTVSHRDCFKTFEIPPPSGVFEILKQFQTFQTHPCSLFWCKSTRPTEVPLPLPLMSWTQTCSGHGHVLTCRPARTGVPQPEVHQWKKQKSVTTWDINTQDDRPFRHQWNAGRGRTGHWHGRHRRVRRGRQATKRRPATSTPIVHWQERRRT